MYLQFEQLPTTPTHWVPSQVRCHVLSELVHPMTPPADVRLNHALSGGERSAHPIAEKGKVYG